MNLFLALLIGFCLLVGLIYFASWTTNSEPTRSKHDHASNESQSETVKEYKQSKGNDENSEDKTKSKSKSKYISRHSTKNDTYESDSDLYETLKKWRDQVANDQGVYKNKVFSNKALERIVDKKPSSKSSLRYTKGVGPRRANKYGEGVLSLLPKQENKNRKDGWKKLRDTVKSEDINNLYHFTDQNNLPSIRVNGGLYSWSHCENNDIHIAQPGGNKVSRNLDRENGLEDYVRLSFVKKPPMYYVAKRDGRIQNPVTLEISPEVILWESTLFSDGNATANRAIVGGELQDFSRIRFDILRQSKWTSESEKHYWQAEVLVKNHLPLRYISNYL